MLHALTPDTREELMKRHWMSICAVGALAAGCASEVELEYQSTLFSETRGLVPVSYTHLTLPTKA